MSKQFAVVLAAIVILFAGIVALSNHKTQSKTANQSKANSKNSSATLSNHVQGSSSTGVTLVEYADYQCPYCEQYQPTLNAVTSEFKDQIQFQFRNFPLVNVHQNAFAAARAAEAASLQGKFWEMHDALYVPTNWQSWTVATDPTTFFSQYAKQLGLNVKQFRTDFASSDVNDVINADEAKGTQLGVQGTPTFFLDGKMVTIANSVPAFQKIIKAEIAKKQAAKPAASPATDSMVPNTPDSAAPTATTDATNASN